MLILPSSLDGAARARIERTRRRYPRWTLAPLAAVTLLTAGCAAYVWQRPGTPPSVMEQDMRECDELAQRLSMDLDMRALADRDWPGGWRRSPYWGFSQPGGSLGFKMRTAQRCMEAKGYRLVKQPPPTAS